MFCESRITGLLLEDWEITPFEVGNSLARSRKPIALAFDKHFLQAGFQIPNPEN
jgi:hypothetical protein